MGERHSWLFEPTFQRAIKVAATDERLTSDGGVVLLREADHQLGLCESLAGRLYDPRCQDSIRSHCGARATSGSCCRVVLSAAAD